MKVCPKCNKTYDDESLNFCLDDGSVLNRQQTEATSEPPPTVMMPEAPAVTEQQVIAPKTEQAFETAPRYRPESGGGGSRSWIWALLILFAVIILCGGGIVGLVAISSIDSDSEPFSGSSPSPEDVIKKAPKDDRRVLERDNLSTWSRSLQNFDGLTTRYRNGELRVNTKRGLFYVISAGAKFPTYDASLEVKVRNATGRAASRGYGLVVHSDPARVLSRDYAFVIRSDNQTFRVVRHQNSKERPITSWKTSRAINRGTRTNRLEVRCFGNELRFYVNGVLLATEKDFTNYRNGVGGIYTSDEIPIAFSDLVLRK